MTQTFAPRMLICSSFRENHPVCHSDASCTNRKRLNEPLLARFYSGGDRRSRKHSVFHKNISSFYLVVHQWPVTCCRAADLRLGPAAGSGLSAALMAPSGFNIIVVLNVAPSFKLLIMTVMEQINKTWPSRLLSLTVKTLDGRKSAAIVCQLMTRLLSGRCWCLLSAAKTHHLPCLSLRSQWIS